MNKDLQKLSTYPEFYALKKELLDFVTRSTSEINDLDIKAETFPFQAAVKIETAKNIKSLLTTLGLIADQDYSKRKQTYE